MNEQELVAKYGEDRANRYLDAYYEGFSHGELVAIIVDMKDANGDLDKEMEELRLEMENDE